jgi:hypothetical protein
MDQDQDQDQDQGQDPAQQPEQEQDEVAAALPEAEAEAEHSPTPPEYRRLSRVITALGLVFLVVHFTFTTIYLNPVSVIGLAWREPVNSYLEPLFRQRWSLFAPDPPMLDRRLDYQCEVDGEHGEWLSRSEDLLATHARWRFSPAARLRRLETAAIVATVGSADVIVTELLAAQDNASEEQRERVEDLLAHRLAASVVASETGYRLVLAYCREDLGSDPDRMRYRIVTSSVTPYSDRNDPSKADEPRAMTLPWLPPDGFDTLELRAREYLDTYEQQKQERKAAEAAGEPTGDAASEATPVEVGGDQHG